MKVILLDTIKKLGKRHEVVDVKNGFANNYLIPQKLAVPATPEAEAHIASMQDQYEKERKNRYTEIEKLFSSLGDAKEYTSILPANDQGVLYQAFDADAVATTILQKTGLIVPVTYIDLDAPIKHTGTYTIPVTYEDFAVELTFNLEEKE